MDLFVEGYPQPNYARKAKKKLISALKLLSFEALDVDFDYEHPR